MTQPGLTFMMSSTFLPAPEVAVTTMSICGRSRAVVADSTILAPGLSRSMEAFRASSLAVSGETR